MFTADGLEFGFLPGFFNEIATSLGHSGGCGDPYQQIPIPDEAELLAGFSSGLTDVGIHMASMLQPSIVSDYDLGGDGDLFKAPEPIIAEPLLALDPVSAAAMSMISAGDDVIADTIQSQQLLSDMFYECKKDLLEQSAIDEPQSLSELLDVKIPAVVVEPQQEELAEEGQVAISESGEGVIQKSVSSGCLNSMDAQWAQGCPVRPHFLDFQGLDFETAFGMRRAYSEGDIQNLGMRVRNGGNNVHQSFERMLTITDVKSEERRQKLSRYRKKKIKRNFGRKIKYACRKALADSQPRVRGRFAKIEECEIKK